MPLRAYQTWLAIKFETQNHENKYDRVDEGYHP